MRQLHRLLVLISLLFAPAAWAQHFDIEFGVSGGSLVVDPNQEAARDPLGRPKFGGNFEDAGTILPSTPNPGWATPEDGFQDPGYEVLSPLAPLSILPMGELMFWSGSSWSAGPASGERLHATRQAGPITYWDYAFSAASVEITDPGDVDAGLVGTAFGNGTFHSHIDFFLEKDSLAQVPALGAYAFELLLTSPSLANSGSFLIALNNGLTEAEFDTAFTALGLPEPERCALLLVGLGLVALKRSRRRATYCR
jgi:hypothetical protein